jgi:hypothetical protein
MAMIGVLGCAALAAASVLWVLVLRRWGNAGSPLAGPSATVMVLLILACLLSQQGYSLIRVSWGEGASWAAAIGSGMLIGMWMHFSKRVLKG